MDLAVGLKNDVEQAATLAPAFDFAVNEECARYKECADLRVFTAAGKPVFHVEYDLDPGQFCAQAKALGFSSMKKKQALDAWRQPC
jgi:endo-alpha-1,4-polygalactosaminidase (GH114 family)